MEVLRQIEALSAVPGPVHLAIGVFDGLHLGHRGLIERAIDGGRRDGGSAVVVTFEPHPARVLRPDDAPRLLTCGRHRRRLLARAGVDRLLAIPFDAAFAAWPAARFVEELASACRPLRRICVGYNWRFGRGREGDIHLLTDLGARLGFEVTALPAVRVGDDIVSSTLIRECVEEGDLGRAARLLGRPYSVLGEVVPGEKIGAGLGFPTANLDVRSEQFPPDGVYAVLVESEGDPRPGVANLGVRPTIEGGSHERRLEVHLLDWEGGTLYGETLEAVFVGRIRDEQRFSSLDELRGRIALDVEAARAILAGNVHGHR